MQSKVDATGKKKASQVLHLPRAYLSSTSGWHQLQPAVMPPQQHGLHAMVSLRSYMSHVICLTSLPPRSDACNSNRRHASGLDLDLMPAPSETASPGLGSAKLALQLLHDPLQGVPLDTHALASAPYRPYEPCAPMRQESAKQHVHVHVEAWLPGALPAQMLQWPDSCNPALRPISHRIPAPKPRICRCRRVALAMCIGRGPFGAASKSADDAQVAVTPF